MSNLKKETIEKINNILLDKLGLSKQDLSAENSLRNDLAADSLDLVEITMALEDEFDIEIDDDDAYTFEKVGDIYNYFIKKDIGVE